jgi:hypothetical protein
MAVRIRKHSPDTSGTDLLIVCAAESDSEDGDIYVDDAMHYLLVHVGLLYTKDEGDTWHLAAPPVTSDFYLVGPFPGFPADSSARGRIEVSCASCAKTSKPPSRAMDTGLMAWLSSQGACCTECLTPLPRALTVQEVS